MRALWRGEKVLILDEPTSMLTPQGVKDLGAVMKRLRDKGVALILITHKLVEAYELGDRISVLRLGRVVGALPPERLKRTMNEAQATDAVIEMMFGTVAQHERDAEILIGRGRQAHRARAVDRSGAPRLQVRGLTTEATRGACPLRGGRFRSVAGRECSGIAGRRRQRAEASGRSAGGPARGRRPARSR